MQEGTLGNIESLFGSMDLTVIDDGGEIRSQAESLVLGECILGDPLAVKGSRNSNNARTNDRIKTLAHDTTRSRQEVTEPDYGVVSGSEPCLIQEYLTDSISMQIAAVESDVSKGGSVPRVPVSHHQRIIQSQLEADQVNTVIGTSEVYTLASDSDVGSHTFDGSVVSNYMPVDTQTENGNIARVNDTRKRKLIKPNTRNGLESAIGLISSLSDSYDDLSGSDTTRYDNKGGMLGELAKLDTGVSTAQGTPFDVDLVLSLNHTNKDQSIEDSISVANSVRRDIEMDGIARSPSDSHLNNCTLDVQQSNVVIATDEVDDQGIDITENIERLQQVNMDKDSINESASRRSSLLSRTVSKQSTGDRSISSDTCMSLKSRTSSISGYSCDFGDPANDSKCCSCTRMGKGDGSVMMEAVSFFALKHVLALVKEIGDCFSSGEDLQLRWQDVLNMQARAQRFVDEAVRVNFKNDDIRQYQLSLPRSLGMLKRTIPLVTSDNGANTEASAQVMQPAKKLSAVANHKASTTTVGQRGTYNDPCVSRANALGYDSPGVLYDNDDPQYNVKMHTPDTCEVTGSGIANVGTKHVASTSVPQSNEHEISHPKVESNGLPRIRTFNDLKRSCEYEDEVTNPTKRVRKTKESARRMKEDDDDDMSGLDYSLQDETGDISNLCDPLAEARKQYMSKINSNMIQGMDLKIPREVMHTHARLFRDDFEFSSKVNEINTQVFGYIGFRGVQLAAINAVLMGKDCFVMMATGGGKSHCFQLPSKLLGGVVVVFSPLISLMEDQKRVMERYGIHAETVNASTTAAEIRNLSKRYLDKREIFKDGSILFITPEKFDKSAMVLRLLEELHLAGRLKLFVIDEAHCVSQWGLSFRKDYRKLCNLKTTFMDVPILAMTATATQEVAADVIEVLRIPTCIRLRTTINRPNLWIECREKTKDYLKEMIEILRTTTGCGIVYTLTVSDCEKVAREIENASISVGAYHAKLDPTARKEVQRRWTRGEIRVMTATIAFGMGIDKSDVRFVFHTSAPVSILGYYQEIGRAGRDGKYSTTILWYNLRDFERHKNLGQKVATNRQSVTGEEVLDFPSLSNMREYCQNKSVCRRLLLFRAFGEDPEGVLPANCQGCDNCCLTMMSERVDVTDDALVICKFVEETSKYYTKGILTMNILCDALRGSNRSTIMRYGLCNSQYHGALKQHKPKYIFQVIQELVNLRVLRECRRKRKSFEHTVMMLGMKAKKLKAGQLTVNIICYRPLALSQTQLFVDGEVPGSDVPSVEQTAQPSATTSAEGVAAGPAPAPPNSKRSKSKNKEQTENLVDMLTPPGSVKDTAPVRGVGASKIVEALKGARSLRRRDGDGTETVNSDGRNTARELPITGDNHISLIRHGHKDTAGTKPALTTVCPDKVLIMAHNGMKAVNHMASFNDTNDGYKGDYGLPGSVVGRETPHTDSTHDTNGMHTATRSGHHDSSALIAMHTTNNSGHSMWRGGLSRAMLLMTNGKANSNIDVQIARQNNIRRKVPLDLL